MSKSTEKLVFRKKIQVKYGDQLPLQVKTFFFKTFKNMSKKFVYA